MPLRMVRSGYSFPFHVTEVCVWVVCACSCRGFGLSGGRRSPSCVLVCTPAYRGLWSSLFYLSTGSNESTVRKPALILVLEVFRIFRICRGRGERPVPLVWTMSVSWRRGERALRPVLPSPGSEVGLRKRRRVRRGQVWISPPASPPSLRPLVQDRLMGRECLKGGQPPQGGHTALP